MPEHVDSSSDARTVNNAVRHQYRTLSAGEKAQMQEIKDMGAAFIVVTRAEWTSAAMSASMNWMAWCSAMGLPKVWRCCA